MAKKHVKNHLTNINTYLIIALVLVVGIGLYFTLSVPLTPEKAAEAAAPKKVQLTLLGTDCTDCFNISAAVEFLKQQKTIEITETTEVSLEDSAELAAKYSITRLPAVIIKGETTNLTIPNFEANEDALVFGNSPAPYYDVEAKRVKGRVSVTHLATPNCKECFDMGLIIQQLKQAGIKIIGETTVDAMSAEGQQLVSKYKIEKLPTVIFNKEALEYDVVRQVWSEVGTEESDGKLVLRFVNPPYYNVATKQVDGLVTISYLYDGSCKECFNASVYGDILTQSFNMQYSKEEMIEAESTKGKFLIKKYNITLLPTAVLSKEASAYPNLPESWTQIGTKEADGSFVFRNVPLLGNYFAQTGESFAYKDLASGEVKTGAEEAAVEEVVETEETG